MTFALLLRPSSLAATALTALGIAAPGGGEVPAGAEPAAPPIVTASPAATRLVKADDGLFYVTAEVNGAPVRFVVDTGANVVVLTRADAARAGVAPSRHGPHLQTAAGASAMRWATLGNVRVAGQHFTDTRAAVVDAGLKTSLLGQNLLARLGSVTLRGDRLDLR